MKNRNDLIRVIISLAILLSGKQDLSQTYDKIRRQKHSGSHFWRRYMFYLNLPAFITTHGEDVFLGEFPGRCPAVRTQMINRKPNEITNKNEIRIIPHFPAVGRLNFIWADLSNYNRTVQTGF